MEILTETFRKQNINNKTLRNASFQEITEIINNKVNINLICDLIPLVSNINSKIKLRSKQILASLLLYYRPKEVIGIDYFQTDIFNNSKKMVDFIFQLNEKEPCFEGFNNFIDIYFNSHEKWKNQDIDNQIQDLAKMFWEIEQSIYLEKSNDDEEIKKLKNLQKKILKNVQIIGGIDGLQTFNSIIPIFIDDKFCNKISDTFKDAFWNIFQSKLESEKPDYSVISEMLKDIRYMMINLVPNRPDIHNEIWESIDVDLISQMIEHDAIQPYFIKKIVFYIVEKIKNFGCAADDFQIEKWKKELEKNFEDGFEYSVFFPTYFKKVIEKLEKIKKDIEKFKQENDI